MHARDIMRRSFPLFGLLLLTCCAAMSVPVTAHGAPTQYCVQEDSTIVNAATTQYNNVQAATAGFTPVTSLQWVQAQIDGIVTTWVGQQQATQQAALSQAGKACLGSGKIFSVHIDVTTLQPVGVCQ